MTRHAMTIRLDPDQARDLETIAQVEGHSMNEVVADALNDRIAARRADPAFAARLRSAIEQNKRALERLAE